MHILINQYVYVSYIVDVTQCILDELMQLDKEEYGKAQYVARKKLKFRKCGHSPCLSARDCIQDMIGTTHSFDA
jgi:rRNA-processing protein FCF1